MIINRLPQRCATLVVALLPALCAANLQNLQADDQPAKFSKAEFTFKTDGELNIRADVHRHASSEKRPVVVWLHGGALIMGSRTGVPKQLLELAEAEQFVIASLGYRLAPEAQLTKSSQT